MDLDPPVPKYNNSDSLSFAYPSVRERWPAIITQIIDDVHRTISDLPSELNDHIPEGKTILSSLASLKYEMQHNRALTPLQDDGNPDIPLYNAELDARTAAALDGPANEAPKWHNAEWLFSECYMYRRIATIFSTTTHWKSYDYFSRQKIATFRSSRPAVLELCAKYKEIITNIRTTNEVVPDVHDESKIADAEKLLFTEMAEICLWGNATDLSLLTNMTYEDIQKLQGSDARKESEKNILFNDLPKAFEILNDAKRSKEERRRVDIVLDNAGFELFVDLVLAGYLLATGLATEVVLHPKSLPWFVSDVLPGDFSALLDAMRNPRAFYEVGEDGKEPVPLAEDEAADIRFLFEHWSQLHSDGQIVLRPNGFWTHAGSFWRMPKVAPDLYDDLKESELVVFKGDLNYRKVIGDAAWDPTTPMHEAAGPLGKSSGIRVLALRTCKGDTVVGLPKGRDEELRQEQGGQPEARKWAWKGKWAVVELSDGKTA
ncbi:Hairy/enhancer-of-split with YRPW motif protein 2 [Exophiala xenobiotica]|uniref:Sugar phosphate phosphatase n=1 Tax=Lithohypha guttulata TaxID=1690604 RepID=A0ABR0JWR3_9EURO|nr:Hairy/enhancer-of-split with YRPW motif protein 2 [Lithohypha guttulata]KAK5310265.1 Hairy/enhancer-of-split with YRPW motif protein 2 [Exophiala xenobiotica]